MKSLQSTLRVLAVLLSLTLLAAMTACFNPPHVSTPEDTTAPTQEAVTLPPITIPDLTDDRAPTDTADYYASDSLVDPHEQKETFWVFITKHIHPSVHAFAVKKHRTRQEKKKAKQEQQDTQEKQEGKENADTHE